MYESFIGIAEMKLSTDPNEMLTILNLGSCVAFGAYDHYKGLGGLIHCLLPLDKDSKNSIHNAELKPAKYVNTGVVMLLNKLLERGANKHHLKIVIAGGASILDKESIYAIGKKNSAILLKLLEINKLSVNGIYLGGENSRSISLNIGNGIFIVKEGKNTFDI